MERKNKDYDKKYREKNKEQINQNQKKYRNKKKDQLNAILSNEKGLSVAINN